MKNKTLIERLNKRIALIRKLADESGHNEIVNIIDTAENDEVMTETETESEY